MRSRYPARQTEIPISLDVYDQLQWVSCRTGYEKEDWEIATEAIDEWVRRHDPNALAGPAHAGYQWKRLFLPDGTVLRTVFGEKNYHCMIEGDRIVYEKRAVSPSGFVNAVGGIRRNAWKCAWILLPDSKHWKLADDLRTGQRPRHARKPARAARNEQPSSNARAAVDVPLVPVESGTVPPSAVRPASVMRPARRGRFALAAFKARHTQHAVNGEVPRTLSAGLCQPQPIADKAPSPPEFMHGHERRINREDRIAVALRQELLPLLYRMYAIDGERLTTRASPVLGRAGPG